MRSDSSLAVNVSTSILGPLPEQICSLWMLKSKQELCLLWELQVRMLICVPIQGQFRHLTWFREKLLHFCLSAFQSTHHNNIHYSPSAYCLVSLLKGANAQLEALLHCQFLTRRCAFVVQYIIPSVLKQALVQPLMTCGRHTALQKCFKFEGSYT